MTAQPQMSGSVSNRSRRLLWFGVFIAIVLIGATFAVAYYNILETKVNMENEILQRQKTITSSRTETTDAWLDSLVEQSKRLVGSDLFQLFTSEVDRLPGGVPLLFAAPEESKPDGDDRSGSHVNQLSSQLPLMRTMLSEFVAYTGFSSARIVNSKAESYMSTEAVVSPLSSAQRAYVARVVETGALLYAPLEIQPKGLTLDIYLPIMPPRYQQQNSRPVAVIILTQQVDAKLTELLSPGVVEEKGRELKLVQKNGDIFQNVVPGMNQPRLVSDFPAGSRGVLPFALRKGVSNDNVDVYSSGIPLRTADWWIVAEHDASILQTALAERQKTVYILAALVSLALILLFSAVWWRLVGQEQSTINAHITDLLSLIEDQKKLLDGINSTISDPISLTDSKGTYKYVNSAFAVAVGRTVDDVVGLDSQAVFGFDTAKRLNSSDQHVLMTGDSISINEVLWLQSKRYYFQISKTPLREEGVRTPQGIVSVFRDITQLVETQERGRRVVQQTIDALVRTIEESDPFLGGHSRIMGGIAMLVAKQLRLPDSDAATIGAAANLSQIGKMYVPRAILLKPGTLTEEEKQEMERHVEHTRTILKNIEFDLPVLDAITQMNERLDGKGYPQGVTGDKISVHARVLAVANAFTAMARPRSYRPALPVEEVISILEKQRGSYDQDVVAALRQIIATPAGERLVQQAAASKVA